MCELKRIGLVFLVLAAILFSPAVTLAAEEAGAGKDEAAELAKKLSNPVAALISVPFQLNYDRGIGPDGDGDRWLLNVQPVVPISLDENWNAISRTIVPLIWQNDVSPGVGSDEGMGDIVQSVFFSPKAPTSDGWIWGVGPVFLFPTGTEDRLTGDKWGSGPTGVLLKQDGPWTYGILANHIWSFAGESDRADVSATFLQPFLSYTTPSAVTLTLNTESTYDWESKEWQVPINASISKVTKIGGQLLSFGGGVRYYADSTPNGPEGWGFRLTVTLLFPK
jgi:hypothetical protein